MIALEYDVPTSGVRVSFVLQDKDMAKMEGWKFEDLMFLTVGQWCPQTKHNLRTLRAMLDAILEEEE
jgi:hypothetical protein